MKKKKGNAVIYVAALLLFLGGVGYLVISGVSQDSVYFLKVSEALAMEPGKLDQARLFGVVSEEDLAAKSDRPGADFTLLDKEHRAQAMRVDYSGALPSTFKPGAEVIVEGRLDRDTGVFKAVNLITKCPSKYEKRKG